MELGSMRKALADARRELDAVRERFELLRQHKERLDNVVTSLQSLLDAEVNEQSVITSSAVEHKLPEADNSPLWLKAKLALREMSRPATVPEIQTHLARTNDPPPSADAVRIAMLRKPEVFLREGRSFSVSADDMRGVLLDYANA